MTNPRYNATREIFLDLDRPRWRKIARYQGQPCLPHRRFRLHLPRLPRAAAADRPSDGLPVGAVHGFCDMLWKLLRESKVSEAPTHIAVMFDASATPSATTSTEYKAQRPPPPEELIPQFALIRDAVKAFNVACIELEGYEADDLIATYARRRTCRRRSDDRLVRQGPDAARAPRRRHARRHEEPSGSAARR